MESAAARDGRYELAAYEFINQAVRYTAELNGGAVSPRHVSAMELLDGVCAFARGQYGPLAWEVLSSWNMQTPMDVGNVVFNMIAERVLARGEGESLEDFNISYDMRAMLEPAVPEESGTPRGVPLIV